MNKQSVKVEAITLAAMIILFQSQIIPARGESLRMISSIIQLPKELYMEDQIYEDINLDGLKDLALSVSNREKPYERSLRIHYQRNSSPGFSREPDEIVSLTPDVIAYALADADQNPGPEILLFTANACFGYRLHKANEDKIFKIADLPFLWQIPDPYNVFSWQGAVLDFNNDCLYDLVLPQSKGFRILFQKKTGFIPTPLLEMPKESNSDNSSFRIQRERAGASMSLNLEGIGNISGAAANNKPLVKVNHSINVPVFTDFDGDGYRDIMVQTSRCLYFWKQETVEPCFRNNYISLKIPKGNNEVNEPDFYSNQYILDLNHDKKCDFILFTRDKTTKKVFTQILIYLNQVNSENKAALFDKDGMPQQLIKIAGLPGKVQFQDINGDGYPDLSFITFNPDLLDQVETLASKSIKLQFLAFFNNKGSFSRNPEISQEVKVSVEKQDQSGINEGHFWVDFNNDGLLDMLIKDTKNHIGLHLLKKTKNSITISDKNVWDMTIPDKTRIVYEKTDQGKAPALLIMSPDQVIQVRFK